MSDDELVAGGGETWLDDDVKGGGGLGLEVGASPASLSHASRLFATAQVALSQRGCSRVIGGGREGIFIAP